MISGQAHDGTGTSSPMTNEYVRYTSNTTRSSTCTYRDLGTFDGVFQVLSQKNITHRTCTNNSHPLRAYRYVKKL